MNEQTEKVKRQIKCTVTSDKMAKSRVAKIERLVKDSRTKKYIKKTTKLMFHDENNETKIGDQVFVVQTRPSSARKRFALSSVLVKAAN